MRCLSCKVPYSALITFIFFIYFTSRAHPNDQHESYLIVTNEWAFNEVKLKLKLIWSACKCAVAVHHHNLPIKVFTFATPLLTICCYYKQSKVNYPLCRMCNFSSSSSSSSHIYIYLHNFLLALYFTIKMNSFFSRCFLCKVMIHS